jgi:hypothetical protein
MRRANTTSAASRAGIVADAFPYDRRIGIAPSNDFVDNGSAAYLVSKIWIAFRYQRFNQLFSHSLPRLFAAQILMMLCAQFRAA